MELLWCNSKIMFNGISFKYKQWAKYEIIRVKDVVYNSSLDATFMQSKLINKSVFIFEYEKLKKSTLPSWLNEKHHVQSVQNCAPKNLMEMKFKIPGGMEKCFSELSAKKMYHIFMFSSELQLKPTQYWMSKILKKTYILINGSKWYTWANSAKENRLTSTAVYFTDTSILKLNLRNCDSQMVSIYRLCNVEK